MSLVYAECPLDVRRYLATQYFVDAIGDEETQLSTRLIDFTDLKSALAYSMKFESAKTNSKISIHARSRTENGAWRERDDKLESLLKALEKLVNCHAAEQNAPRRAPKINTLLHLVFKSFLNIFFDNQKFPESEKRAIPTSSVSEVSLYFNASH
ncbi:hypothetical protein AVEN_229100-1 [Araneus ventricosus]|uniref:Uncharacterized protein n=1 Tax=Araneus ventricosus TaxID=182803 RepID=A0A4Y2MB39_ARAVE|nr:hypothetical protein AVEN_229100-1 [Araneus ventricosus]